MYNGTALVGGPLYKRSAQAVVDLRRQELCDRIRRLRKETIEAKAPKEEKENFRLIVPIPETSQTIKEIYGRPTLRFICECASVALDVPLIDLTGQLRTQRICLSRQITMYACYLMTAKSTVEIGEVMGGRDHSTVLHGIRKVERLVFAGDMKVIERLHQIRVLIGLVGVSDGMYWGA